MPNLHCHVWLCVRGAPLKFLRRSCSIHTVAGDSVRGDVRGSCFEVPPEKLLNSHCRVWHCLGSAPSA
jgi:hypothetical protein